jgi:hypothetical protein
MDRLIVFLLFIIYPLSSMKFGLIKRDLGSVPNNATLKIN